LARAEAEKVKLAAEEEEKAALMARMKVEGRRA